MTTYDSKVIYKFADELYREAAGIVSQAVILAAIFGIAIVYGVRATAHNNTIATGFAVVASLVLGVMLYNAAQRRAFKLRLDAQLALCHVRIEENTRAHGGAQEHGAVPPNATSSRLAS